MPTREHLRLTWRRSSYSNADNGDCVEVAFPPGAMALRDSKDRDGGHLDLPAPAWHGLLAALRD
jgi:hypothetical protein